ncbi:MAG: FecR domain-containing protein [Dysgonamonadaceae bacterium]|jgi:ferric-dicitrate binding protein FerR (iron transport regulator)|nr:FecR domain-containing protein [Dysgonamonadaceae bacterium]
MTEELLHKYIKGEAGQAEKEEITQWLDASGEHMKEFLVLRKIYDVGLWHKEESRIEISGPSSLVNKHSSQQVSSLLKIAAAFIIAFISAYFLFSERFGDEEPAVMQTVYVPPGQRAEITLADGSKVWLNAKSTLLFPNRFDKKYRKVDLDGEAYFEVAFDKEKPFSVITEEYEVRVLGTEFNLLAYKHSSLFEASLIKGSVEISPHDSLRKIFLKPNMKAFTEKGELKTGVIEDYNYFLWKKGIIYFDDETVAEMIKKLELYFDYKIEIKNKKLIRCKFSGKFNAKDGVEHVLRVLQLKHKFKYEKDEEHKIIVIK